MIDANFKGTRFCAADLSWACLRDARLSGVDFSGAILNGTELYGACLTHTDLSGAYLNSTHLSEADLAGSIMDSTTLANLDLSNVYGLEKVNHRGVSSIGIDTIYRSHGRIPQSFLRQAGVPENLITYMASLVGKAIEYRSCFISHSTKDKVFVDRLCVDLQAKGVKCWYAPKDLAPGANIQQSIDIGIQTFDKLMVIFSKNSVESPWVEKEVATADEIERRQNREVLFPIRIDDAVMETEWAWAADIRRRRHIADFRDWRKAKSYKRAFDSLMEHLTKPAPAALASSA